MIRVFVTVQTLPAVYRVRVVCEKWGCVMGEFRDKVAAYSLAAVLDECTPLEAVRLADLAMQFRAALYNGGVSDPR